MKKSIFIIAAMLTAAILAGCTEVAEELPEGPYAAADAVIEPYPVTIGSLVFEESPQNAASLSPAITEIIAELGFGDRLSGRSIYCEYPESIKGLDTLGSAANPDAEAIIGKAPQLLLSQSPIAKKDITAIEAAGTRVLIIPAPSSVEGLYELYSSIYLLFNGDTGEAEGKAKELLSPLEEKLAANENILGRYVYIISPQLLAAGDDTFAGDFLSHMGENAAAESELTAEKLAEKNPDYVILGSEISKKEFLSLLEEAEVSLDSRIICLDEETSELLERPTSRAVNAVDFIRNAVDSPEAEETEDTSEEQTEE